VPQRVAFIHTVSFLVEKFREQMTETLPDVDTFHILNEGLLQDLLRGQSTAEVYRRVVAQIHLAQDTGPDLIVVTCSSTSPAVDIARQISTVPILKVDDPMAAAAIQQGPRIGLLCTASSTLSASTALLHSHAAAAARDIEVVPLLLTEAYDAILAGHRDEHDRIVSAAAADLAANVDVIVLAQASLAHLQDDLTTALPVPVLASPKLLMAELAHRLRDTKTTSAA
jgi:Asp/Glu/hydantoin racemase